LGSDYVQVDEPPIRYLAPGESKTRRELLSTAQPLACRRLANDAIEIGTNLVENAIWPAAGGKELAVHRRQVARALSAVIFTNILPEDDMVPISSSTCGTCPRSCL
jgi:hypothetical protein